MDGPDLPIPCASDPTAGEEATILFMTPRMGIKYLFPIITPPRALSTIKNRQIISQMTDARILNQSPHAHVLVAEPFPE